MGDQQHVPDTREGQLREHERVLLFDIHRGLWLEAWLNNGGSVSDAPHDIMDGYAFHQAYETPEERLTPLARYALKVYRASDGWKRNERRERGQTSLRRFRQERQRLFDEVRRLFGKIKA